MFHTINYFKIQVYDIAILRIDIFKYFDRKYMTITRLNRNINIQLKRIMSQQF